MYTCYIQSLRILASVAEQAGLNLTRSKVSEDTFSRDEAQLFILLYADDILFGSFAKDLQHSSPEWHLTVNVQKVLIY